MKQLNPDSKLLLKAQRYCQYQERSQQEVRNRLLLWGCRGQELESIIATLIDEGFLKEERFANAYAGGKFRIKKWGRIRIRSELRKKHVSEPLIKNALSSIPESDYRKTLMQVINKRNANLKDPDEWKRKNNIARYAISRGFEPELVWEILNDSEL